MKKVPRNYLDTFAKIYYIGIIILQFSFVNDFYKHFLKKSKNFWQDKIKKYSENI